MLVTALSDESSTWTETAASPDGALRRVYTDVDTRLLLGDLLARLRLHEHGRADQNRSALRPGRGRATGR